MARLSKRQIKAHRQACEVLEKDTLTEDEKEFVFCNWNEGANHDQSFSGAFFTPIELAFDMALEVGGDRIIDMCAGIGVLSYAVLQRARFNAVRPDIVCVERNLDYLNVGRKLVPEATWIHADITSALELGRFDCAISNPPFGNVRRLENAPRYAGRDFEFHVIDLAAHIADCGVFILPQASAGFNLSGTSSGYERQKSGKAVAFQELTGLHFDAGCGIDTAAYLKCWNGVSPLCEIVCVEFPPIATATLPDPANDNLPLFDSIAGIK